MPKNFFGFRAADSATFMLNVALEDVVAYGSDIDERVTHPVTVLYMSSGAKLRVADGANVVSKALREAGLVAPFD